MEILMSVLIGVLMSVSVWLMLSRNLVKFLFGLVLISNVANLIIFTVGGLTVGAPPLIVDGGSEVYANSLPQALVLTAIVIGFGLVSFTLILALKAYQALGTVDVDEMLLAEQPAGHQAVNENAATEESAPATTTTPDSDAAGKSPGTPL